MNLTIIPLARCLIANSVSNGESIPLQMIGNFVSCLKRRTLAHVTTFLLDSGSTHVAFMLIFGVFKICNINVSDYFIADIFAAPVTN